MTNIYNAVYEATGSYDVCTCYNIFGIRSGWNSNYLYWKERSDLADNRLGHSHDKRFPSLLCTEFTTDNEVECYYLFGETLLIGHHKVGQCPHKLR